MAAADDAISKKRNRISQLGIENSTRGSEPPSPSLWLSKHFLTNY